MIDKHTLTARAARHDLDCTQASISLNEAWSPYAQATLTCPIPDAGTLADLDPRNDVRVQFTIRQDFGDSDTLAALNGLSLAGVTAADAGGPLSAITADGYTPWNSFGVRSASVRSFDLSLRSRPTMLAGNTMQLTVSSDEALLQDYALVDVAPWAPLVATIRELVVQVLARIGRTLTAGPENAPLNAAAAWQPGVSAWDYLNPILQTAGLRLWCDERRNWRLAVTPTATPGSLTLTATDTIVDSTDDISRDADWYDAAVITYEWTDAEGVQRRAWDVASTPGFSKVASFTYQSAYPGPGAAASLLARALQRGRTRQVTAVSDYQAAPGMDCTISLATGDTDGTLTAVTWSFPDNDMTIATRDLVEN